MTFPPLSMKILMVVLVEGLLSRVDIRIWLKCFAARNFVTL